MSDNYMISTSDNPYNYFTQFDEWLAWDESHGHYTLALLDRVTNTSDELPDHLQLEDVDEAIETIIRENWSGLYVKVANPLFKKDDKE